jgi:hypothetical protein
VGNLLAGPKALPADGQDTRSIGSISRRIVFCLLRERQAKALRVETIGDQFGDLLQRVLPLRAANPAAKIAGGVMDVSGNFRRVATAMKGDCQEKVANLSAYFLGTLQPGHQLAAL